MVFEIRSKNQLFLELNFCKLYLQFLIVVDQQEAEY